MIRVRTAVILAVLAVAVIATLAQSSGLPEAGSPRNQSQGATAQTQKSPSTPTKPDGDYVGSDTCKGCQEDQSGRFNNTAMGKAMVHPRTPDESRGFESCYGPGRAHVEAGGGKDTIPVRFTKDSKNTVAEQNSACVQCHSRSMQLFWTGSPHQSRGMTCVDCHQVHQEVRTLLSDEARFNAPLTEN